MGTPGEQQSSAGCVLTLMGCLLENGDPWKHVELESSTHLVHEEVLRVKTAEFGRGKIWTLDQTGISTVRLGGTTMPLKALQGHPKPHRGAGICFI